MTKLLENTPHGLYCPRGGFYIDPWKPVDHAVITHAHSDHARWGNKHYLAAETGKEVLRIRMGEKANLDFLPFGKPQSINGVTISFMPAGHILGSAQVRIEYKGEVVVISGDYKRTLDSTCHPFEPIKCHTFVTESTFGLPIYRWPCPLKVFEEINEWWRSNQYQGKTTLLLTYALGKAQRLLAGIDPSIGPIFSHGAVEKLNVGYRAAGIELPTTQRVTEVDSDFDWSRALVVAPPSALGTPWTRRFKKISAGMASGWMQIRGTRRRRNVDRGFVLSDHVDWSELLHSISETEAEQVWVTHGYSAIVVRHLLEMGLDAKVLETEFTGESPDEDRLSSDSTPAWSIPDGSPEIHAKTEVVESPDE